MNGRCDNDPLDRAENICDKCGGDYCDACLLYPRGKKRAPICKACAIARSGVRSTSKSSTPLERKNVRKRRKELKEQEEDTDNSNFIFFNEEGSDIVMRDPSVLEPEEVEAPTRRFGKKSKTKSTSAKDDNKATSKENKPKKDKPKKDKSKKDKSSTKKKAAPVSEGNDELAETDAIEDNHRSETSRTDAAPSDMPPPPSSEDAIVEEDPDETIDLGLALSGYDITENTEPVALEDNPFGNTDQSSEDDHDGPTFVPVAEAPLAEMPLAGNDSPTATELLARLHEAENARNVGPAVSSPSSSEEGDPWIPTAMAEPAAAPEAEASFDASVNPFGEAPPKREPMEAWVPPTVTPDDVPLSTDNDIDEPSLDYAPSAFDEPAADMPGFLEEQPFAQDETASFKHDPGFEADVFDASDFEHEGASAETDEAESWHASEPQPLEIIIHAPEPSADHETAVSDSPFGGDELAADSPSSDSGQVATATKADTDEEGNWVPPALRGMLPKTERENDLLPKRRGTD